MMSEWQKKKWRGLWKSSMVVRKRWSILPAFFLVAHFVLYFILILLLYFLQKLPQTNPGFNNTPFKFTKYSNAYMLVYIRESDKDKIICSVDEKDIAEHLRVGQL